MPAILIRDVPDEMHKRLKERAAANRRSLGREALVLLESALTDDAERPTIEEIRAMRVKPLKPISAEFIEKAIKEGRR